MAFRIIYRHMERTLTNVEANEVHRKISEAAADILKVTVRDKI